MSSFVVCALYRFVRLENYQDLREPLLGLMEQFDVRGTLLLANEGVNGTIAGTREGIDAVVAWLRSDTRLAALDTKESFTDELPFKRCKVKLKKEIVTLGVEGIDPNRVVGTYVEPSDWNTLISDPEVVLIDTRNQYEVDVGTFKGALNPATDSFRQFPEYVKQHLDPSKNKKVAMFCTGGIRCEKSTAYLKEQGFEEVYHLKGGILKYLEEVPEEETLWQGECFVFDDRVTVDHKLQPGKYDLCNACRLPITEADKLHPNYEHGVSCPHCYGTHSDEQIARFREREHQMRLAEERGMAHIGKDAIKSTEQLRQAKRELRKRQQERQ
jgi:UPF0176 protein